MGWGSVATPGPAQGAAHPLPCRQCYNANRTAQPAWLRGVALAGRGGADREPRAATLRLAVA